MLKMFQDYLERLEMLHREIEKALAGLPPPALDWQPAEGANSLAVLTVHVAGAQRYWMGEVIGRDPAHRDRDAEFQTRDLDEAALLQRLRGAMAHSRVMLEGLTAADMDSPRISTRDGRIVTVMWALAHVIQHAAIHAGHAQLTRQLWDQQHPQQEEKSRS